VRRFDQHGLVVQQGRIRVRPFGRIGQWPEQASQRAAIAATDRAAAQRRVEYRQRERLQPCGGCGAASGFPHNLGCATPWG
jgi:hypothetical protein